MVELQFTETASIHPPSAVAGHLGAKGLKGTQWMQSFIGFTGQKPTLPKDDTIYTNIHSMLSQPLRAGKGLYHNRYRCHHKQTSTQLASFSFAAITLPADFSLYIDKADKL